MEDVLPKNFSLPEEPRTTRDSQGGSLSLSPVWMLSAALYFLCAPFTLVKNP